MDYGEYWLLETALELPVPFCLVPEDSRTREMCYNGQWNKRPHMLSEDQLVETFLQLFASGDITGFDKKRPECIPSRTELESAFADDIRNLQCYKLTPKGGARWEEFAEADWNRYYSFDWEGPEPEHIEIATASEQDTERAFLFLLKDQEVEPIAGTEIRTQLSPWQATYWKTLPRGFSLSFRHLPRLWDDPERERRNEQYEQQYSPEEKRQQRAKRKAERLYWKRWYKKHPDTPSKK